MRCLDSLDFLYTRIACQLEDDHSSLHEARGITGGRRYLVQWLRKPEDAGGDA